MSKIQPSYNVQRMDLCAAIPLASPLTICLEATRMCNLKCFYCMHFTRGVSGGVLECTGVPINHMDMKLFEKIAHGIMNFPQQPKSLTFSGLGEPLVNPRLGEMVRKLNEAGYVGRCEVTTNGVLLTPERSIELVEAGVAKFRISVQALSSARYKEVCGVAVDMDEYINNIRWLFEHKKQAEVCVKILDANLQNEEENKQFYETFDGICDKMFIEHLVRAMPQTVEFRNDSGVETNLNLYGSLRHLKKVCSAAFYTLQITSDGNVFPCALAGVPSEFAIGNCNGPNSLDKIWDSELRNSFLKKQLKIGASQIPFCDKCDCVRGLPFDNIDDCADELLMRLEKN